MHCRNLFPLVLSVFMFAVGNASASPAESKSAIGKKIDRIALADSSGKTWSLDDLKSPKAIVVVFLGTECPVNNAYLPRLIELQKTYSDRGVTLIGINANRHDTAKRIAEHVQSNRVSFPVLLDPMGVMAEKFGAQKTPEAFVLDAGHVIRYQGRIDDQFGVGYRKSKPSQNDLVDALTDVLAGKTVAKAETKVEGCFISRLPAAKADATIQYAKHVAPILQKNCQACHRPGQIGPMPLLTYEDAASWSETIRTAVEERRMPPWHADGKHHGVFANERSLTEAERVTLLGWIDQGCAKGSEQEPPPRQFADTWQIGKPDAVFDMPIEYTVPAKVERGISYKYYVIPTNYAEDRWIQAAEARPGSREVVHHILVYVRKPGQPMTRGDGIGDGMLAAYAPGDIPSVFPPGSAKKLPKGSFLVFQMHYTPDGTQRKDRSSVALVFAKNPPTHEAHTRSIAQRRIAIPPGDGNYQVVSTSTFPKESVLLSFLPHMHLRGKSFEYIAHYPDGKKETLLTVPRYDFNWQTSYRLSQPRTLPAGTRIECTAHFDNSTSNLNNPDPTRLVRWGEQTWDEMMIGFVDYYVVDKPATK